MKKSLFIFLLAIALGCMAANANTVGITWSYDAPGALNIFDNFNTTALSGAGTSANGDGFVLQLGYYTGATTANAFLGTWVPVFGPSTSNSLFSTASMGDNKGTTGTDDRFTFTGTIDTSIPSTTTGIPSGGQIMSIRYYNATSLGAATFYGAASNATSWLWTSPALTPPTAMAFSLNGGATSWQGGATRPQTNISAVPEPSTYALLGTGLLMLGAVLRRRKTA